MTTVILMAAPVVPPVPVDPSWTDVAGFWISLGSLVVAAVGAFLVIRQIRNASKAEVASAQPYVSVFLEMDPAHPREAQIVVKNFGGTSARDVKVRFNTNIERSKTSLAQPTYARVDIPDIPLLAPGQEWRNYYDFIPDRKREANLPMRYDGKVYFTGLQAKNFNEPVALDLTPWVDRILHEDDGSLKDVIKGLTKIHNAISRITATRKTNVGPFADPMTMFAVPARDQPELPSGSAQSSVRAGSRRSLFWRQTMPSRDDQS